MDTWHRSKLPKIARRPEAHWDRTWRAITRALELGYSPLKVNCVVMRGVNDEELVDFVRATKDMPIQVRFIELMPFGGNDWSESAFMPSSEQIARIQQALPDFQPVDLSTSETAALAGDEHDTARVWHVPGHAGTVGFISSMTDAFCGSCNRLRLTADGSLKVCLHGHDEASLRDVLRAGGTPEQLDAVIAAAVRGKHFALGGRGDRHGLAQAAHSDQARPMVKIGG